MANRPGPNPWEWAAAGGAGAIVLIALVSLIPTVSSSVTVGHYLSAAVTMAAMAGALAYFIGLDD